MNVYVFEPYNWGYCGGAIVVVAETEQRAKELILTKQRAEHDDEYLPWNDSYAERFKQNEEDGNCWELTSVIECYTPVQIERVICFNYNYA